MTLSIIIAYLAFYGSLAIILAMAWCSSTWPWVDKYEGPLFGTIIVMMTVSGAWITWVFINMAIYWTQYHLEDSFILRGF